MALGPNSALEVTRSVTTVQGTRLLRLQETFKGNRDLIVIEVHFLFYLSACVKTSSTRPQMEKYDILKKNSSVPEA